MRRIYIALNLDQKQKKEKIGACCECGVSLIDWDRLASRQLSDIEYLFKVLRLEFIRYSFLVCPIDQHALNYARRKGRNELIKTTRERIRKSIGVACPPRDGRQTPKKKNPIFYAQHATATCCRKCLEYWHGIPQGKVLTQEEVAYCVKLIEHYFCIRFPDLDETRTKVPYLKTEEMK